MKMDNREYKKVTRDEYVAFLRNYPNQLKFDCTGICEPPMGSYNDFTGGKVWPESIVAKEFRSWLGPNGERDTSSPGKYWEYFILVMPNGDSQPAERTTPHTQS